MRLIGTYRLRFEQAPPQYAGYERTIQISNQFGRLMVRFLGNRAEPLLSQGNGEFAVRSAPEQRFRFSVDTGRAVRLEIRYGDSPNAWRLAGSRVDDSRVPAA